MGDLASTPMQLGAMATALTGRPLWQSDIERENRDAASFLPQQKIYKNVRSAPNKSLPATYYISRNPKGGGRMLSFHQSIRTRAPSAPPLSRFHIFTSQKDVSKCPT